MQDKTLIFGGTTEGRLLCEAFSRNRRPVTVCTATAYGAALLEALPHVQVHGQRLDADAMADYLCLEGFHTVIDATHPYAVEVTRNIRAACQGTKRRYIRVLREDTAPLASDGVRPLPDMDAVVDYLATREGNALLTTGSKELPRFRRLADYSRRLYVRVLPDPQVMAHCAALGFRGRQIIALQGPFSHEFNVALLREFHCAFLVTKSSGSVGGLEAKLSAAAEVGAEVLLIQREKPESGISLDDALRLLALDHPVAKENA